MNHAIDSRDVSISQLLMYSTTFITGPPNGPVCSACWRLSSLSVVVCNAAGGCSGRPPGAWAVGRPTLHGGPVRLRPVRATPCL